jgi:hypothetical protein
MSVSSIDGNVRGMFLMMATINPASVAAATTADQTFTVRGLRASDVLIMVQKPTLSAGLGIANWRISAANTIAITFVNATAGAVDPGSEVYKLLVARPDTPSLYIAIDG